jgi:hypothetical protein
MLERDESGHLNPVEEIDGLWYFWDETWANNYGPFKSSVEANLALLEYCENFLKSAEEHIEP